MCHDELSVKLLVLNLDKTTPSNVSCRAHYKLKRLHGWNIISQTHHEKNANERLCHFPIFHKICALL